MNPQGQADTPNILAIKQMLMARANQPGIGQRPTAPAIGQNTQTGAPALPNTATPQPQFSSQQPFMGPTQAPQGLDDETKKMAKTLAAKLLQVL